MNEQMAMEMAIRARQQLSGIDATVRKIKQMKQHFRSFANSVKNHVRRLVAAFAKLRAAIAKLHNAFRTLRNTALKAFTAIVALNAIPIKFFADFEQKMAEVNTLLDVSEKKFQQMGQGVIQISNELGESATSLATGLYDIVSAGVDASDSLQVLEQSARAARAGVTDTQTAVNAGLATINSYNLEISELSKVFDLQFQTVRKGVITYEQLSNAQGQMLPSARKLNERLENVYGSLAFITKNGLSADEASTSLARAFDGLATKADKLAEYSVRVYDEFGKYRGILPIMEDLSEVMEGLSDQQMQEVLGNIGFDIRAARAIIPMITNIDSLRESIAAMEDSSGAMEAAFEKATNTIQFRFNRAKENVINAFRQMGQGWRTEINQLLDNVSAMAGALQEFVLENKEAIKSIALFAAKLTGIIAIVGLVGTAIFALMTPMGAVTAGIALFGAAWYLNLWDVRSVTQDVINYVLEKWDELKAWWQETTWLEKLQDIGTIALNIAGFVWDSAVDVLDSLLDWIKSKIDKNGDGKINFDEAMDLALDLTLIAGAITAGFTALKLTKLIAGALGTAGVIGAKALGALAIGLTIGATLSILLDPHVENFEDWKQQFIDGLKYLFSKQFWQDIWIIAKVEWQMMWNDISEWTTNFITRYFTKDFWLGVWDNMKESFQEVWNNMWKNDPEANKAIREQMNNSSYNPPGGFASGGYISGPGTSTSDSIPAMLSNGEFVINAQATKQWLPFLLAINNGEIPGFANGSRYPLGTPASGYSMDNHEMINTLLLENAGLQDNSALSYLAKISHDTENFQNVISLISGVQKMQSDYQNLINEWEKEKEKMLEELMKNTDPDNQKADTTVNWNGFLETMNGLLNDAIRDLEGVLSQSTIDLISGITSAMDSFSQVGGGFFGGVDAEGNALPGVLGELKSAYGIFSGGGGIKASLGELSQGTVAGIASIFDGIKNSIISGLQSAAQKAAEKFNEAIEEFNDAVAEFKSSVSQGGSLSSASYDYGAAIDEAQKSAKAYADKLAKERRAGAAKTGGGIGGLIGGVIGFVAGGPAGAAIGAGIGGAGGAGVGALGSYYKDSDYKNKLKEMMEEIRGKLNEMLEQAFGLDSTQITAGINDAIMSAANSGDNMAAAIGKSLYGHVKNSLQSVFLWAQNNVIKEHLDPLIQGMKDKITNAIISGESIDFNNLIDIEKLISVAEKAEELGKSMQEYMGELKQQLIDAGVGRDVISAIFPADEMSRRILDSLQSAMGAAMDSGNLTDFTKTMGESIYENAKQGLINAFMESAVYQKMFQQWFDTTGMEFTGNLSEDFAMMNSMLDNVRRELRIAELDFGYNEVAGAGSNDGNPIDSDYYAGASAGGDGSTVINNKYIYAPSGKFYKSSDRELFEEFLQWKKDIEDDEV